MLSAFKHMTATAYPVAARKRRASPVWADAKAHPSTNLTERRSCVHAQPITSSLLLLIVKTSDDFNGHRPVTSEIPDYESDPYRLLASAEDTLVNLYHFNLNGEPVMTTTIKDAMQEAGVVHTRHAYFDLIDFCDEFLQNEQLRANVLNSVAWMCDVTAINLARAMFFRDYKESDGSGTTEAYEAFMANFLSTLDIDGSGATEFVDGVARDLVCVLGFAPQMHDVASAAQSAIGREYNPRSFEALLAAEKPQATTPKTRAKMQQIAKFVEGDDAPTAQVEQTLEVLLQRAESQAARSHENRKRINPIVLGIIEVAKRHQKDDIEFYQLDAQLQERLVKATITAINNAMGRLATFDSIEMVEFALIMKEAKAAIAKLNEVMVTFRTPEEDATIRAQQRALKAKAASSDAPDFEKAQADEAAALEAKREAAQTQAATTAAGQPPF